MNNQQNTYGQMAHGQMMPPPHMRPKGWRERWMRRLGMDMSRPMQKREL